jgi:ubiquinone/menaquinone biosynthesis C-methylase UbiE
MPADNWQKKLFDPAVYTPATPGAVKHAVQEAAFTVRAMGLKKGMSVLDVACGPGRHSVELARRGCDVTGLDFCRGYLDEARAAAKKRGVKADFVHGDMRKMKFAGKFDAVICMFTSFGYFTPAQDLLVLKSMTRALKPGGRLLLDVQGEEPFLKTPSGRDWFRREDGSFLLEEWKYDLKRARLENRWVFIGRDGKATARDFKVNIYNKARMEKIFGSAGLKPLKFYNGFERSRNSSRLVALAAKNWV